MCSRQPPKCSCAPSRALRDRLATPSKPMPAARCSTLEIEFDVFAILLPAVYAFRSVTFDKQRLFFDSQNISKREEVSAEGRGLTAPSSRPGRKRRVWSQLARTQVWERPLLQWSRLAWSDPPEWVRSPTRVGLRRGWPWRRSAWRPLAELHQARIRLEGHRRRGSWRHLRHRSRSLACRLQTATPPVDPRRRLAHWPLAFLLSLLPPVVASPHSHSCW